jgi:hypothetical protein
MENKVLNIDFENMNEEQLLEIQEKAKNQRQKSLDRRVIELENWRIQADSKINVLNNNYKNLQEDNEKLTTKVEKIKQETDKVTDSLMIHGIERRNLEKYIHSVIYKELEKDSIKDLLFHRLLTSKCKSHLSASLTVSSFNWIKVDDIVIAKTLAMKYLNKATIHNLMRKRASELYNEFNPKIQRKTKKILTAYKLKQKNLLELLIEECGGNLDEI